jgi:hypothetical protein
VVKDGKLEFTETGLAHGKDHGAPFPISTKFDLNTLGTMNPGVRESVAIGKRADVVVAPMGYADGQLDARQYYDIMSKWMSDCIMQGQAADAIKGAAAGTAEQGDHRLIPRSFAKWILLIRQASALPRLYWKDGWPCRRFHFRRILSRRGTDICPSSVRCSRRHRPIEVSYEYPRFREEPLEDDPP